MRRAHSSSSSLVVLWGFIFLAAAAEVAGCASSGSSNASTSSGSSGSSGYSTSGSSAGNGVESGSSSTSGVASGSYAAGSTSGGEGAGSPYGDGGGDDAATGDDAAGDASIGAADAAGSDGSPTDGGTGAGDATVPDATTPDAGPPPFVATGAPITGADNQWTWVGFPDTYCRDGSQAGIAVNFESASSKVMIFLQGGGACFDPLTCATNPANVTGQQTPAATGVFDRTNAKNPVAGWNFVYVPYCTGDVGMGTNANGSVSGVTGTQKFVGYLNLQSFLNRVVPTFPKPSQVLLTGISAGGFAAAMSAPLVQRAFPSVKVAMVDDSGPPMSDTYLPSCLQDEWRTTWGFDDSVLKECGSACPDPTDYAMDYAKFLATTYPDRMVGLLDSETDSVISGFYGYGNNGCTGSLLTPVAGATYTAGLENFRSTITPLDANFGTYFPDGSQHTWIASASLYTETQSGTALIDWFTNIVNDTSVSQVGP